MVSTVIFLVLFLVLLLSSVVLWALFLRLGLWWAKTPNVSAGRVILTTGTVVVLQITINLLFLLAPTSSNTQSIFLAFVELAAAVMIPCMVITRFFKVRFLRALQAWLPTLLAPVTIIVFVLLVFRPLLYEAFLIPTNSMAPTLVGKHWRGTCPDCGAHSYCTPMDEGYYSPPMICDHFHVTEMTNVDNHVYSGDRLLVAKFLTPQRWDLIVFQYPEDPSALYVMRLVGLPGEKIHIQDGYVWADGKRLTPPASIQGIEYLSDLPVSYGPDLWGSADRPALLGDDEYFVLGDFSVQSKDSRLWEQGAPGHNPFAVPESHLKGVVTHIYWPIHRRRIFR